jgi:hypothetical protein
MALAHRRNAPFSIPIFLKDMREEFNSLNASNHFAGCNERISTKRMESESCQIARHQIPLVNEESKKTHPL